MASIGQTTPTTRRGDLPDAWDQKRELKQENERLRAALNDIANCVAIPEPHDLDKDLATRYEERAQRALDRAEGSHS